MHSCLGPREAPTRALLGSYVATCRGASARPADVLNSTRTSALADARSARALERCPATCQTCRPRCPRPPTAGRVAGKTPSAGCCSARPRLRQAMGRSLRSRRQRRAACRRNRVPAAQSYSYLVGPPRLVGHDRAARDIAPRAPAHLHGPSRQRRAQRAHLLRRAAALHGLRAAAGRCTVNSCGRGVHPPLTERGQQAPTLRNRVLRITTVSGPKTSY